MFLVFAKVTKMVTPNEVRDFARYLPLGLYESDIANLMRQCRNEQATLKVLNFKHIVLSVIFFK